jgi:hypothetical protein
MLNSIQWCVVALSGIVLIPMPIFAAAQTVVPATQPAQQHGLRSQDVRLTAIMPSTEIPAGNPVLLDVLIENFGDEARVPLITVPANDFRIALHDSNGQAVAWSRAGTELQVKNAPGQYGGSSGPIPAKAISRYRLQLDLLADLTIPGAYSVSVSLDVGSGINPMNPNTPYTKPDAEYPDHTQLESNRVQFMIVKNAGSRPFSDEGEGLPVGEGGRGFPAKPLSEDAGQPATRHDAAQ